VGWIIRHRRRERLAHNDRDVDCEYWTGDRSGSVIGVVNERCTICNPKEK
jgi:hypothetical protein